MRLLKHIINSDRRGYFIEKVNEPIVWLINWYARRYPEPTHDNVVHPNSHILLGIRDEFRRCWGFHGRRAFEAVFKLIIVCYERSPNYRNPLDWAIMMVQKSNWKPFNPNRQMPYWRGNE